MTSSYHPAFIDDKICHSFIVLILIVPHLWQAGSRNRPPVRNPEAAGIVLLYIVTTFPHHPSPPFIPHRHPLDSSFEPQYIIRTTYNCCRSEKTYTHRNTEHQVNITTKFGLTVCTFYGGKKTEIPPSAKLLFDNYYY